MKKWNLRIVDYKFLYTIYIGVLYLLGKSIPLMGVQMDSLFSRKQEMQSIFLQSVSGDLNRSSVLALGISPYMLAGIIIGVVAACKRADEKAKISPKRMNRYLLGITLIFAFIMALFRVNGLEFTVTGAALIWCKIAVVFELVAGAMLILWLADRNKQYGIGGQSALIFMNVLEGIMSNLFKASVKELILPVLLSVFAMLVTVIMENSEKRIVVQRVSIHNIYADKNYIAIKLNPIGVMPAMFGTAFFMIPQMIVAILARLFPHQDSVLWLQENMNVEKPLGLILYFVLLYVLTIVFSIVFISPRDMTDNLLKTGDCIPGLHAGEDTKRYLKRTLVRLGFLSATVMSICLGIPMILRAQGLISGSLAMLPTSIMMLTGITGNLYEEIISLRSLDAYKPFI